MFTSLKERTTELRVLTSEEASREASRSGALDTPVPSAGQAVSETSEHEPASQQRTETPLHRIFKGHEEFLGWTPD